MVYGLFLSNNCCISGKQIGESQDALFFLEKAYQSNQWNEGLVYELAYAYNMEFQYERAIEVLDTAIMKAPNYQPLYRELGFALVRLDRLDEAEQANLKAIELTDDEEKKSKIAMNMAHAFYKIDHKEKLRKWIDLTRKYAEKNSTYLKYIEHFEKTFDN